MTGNQKVAAIIIVCVTLLLLADDATRAWGH